MDLLEIVVRYTPVYPRNIQRRERLLVSVLVLASCTSLPQAAAAIAL